MLYFFYIPPKSKLFKIYSKNISQKKYVGLLNAKIYFHFKINNSLQKVRFFKRILQFAFHCFFAFFFNNDNACFGLAVFAKR